MLRVAAIEACERALSPGTCRMRIVRAAAFAPLLLLAVPLLLGLAFGIPPPAVFALIASTLLLQAAAAVVGLSLGLHPAVVLAFLTSVAAAVMLGILELCDLFAERSRFIQGLLRNIDAKTGRIESLKRYGCRRVALPVPEEHLSPLHARRMDNRGHRGHGGDDGARPPGLLTCACIFGRYIGVWPASLLSSPGRALRFRPRRRMA
ncbi:MAG: hypothetical protein XE10_1645 [Methanoculleus marisnigri]|uniref:Uncharacterized protein n=1 Tax=Methanoculleus marisnigri TaxID=2198 RepID=A0A101IR85_9EURY|nr:MAG: hypothetical protein XE10_1645 [Methanoculleus marisnigri]